MPESPNSERIAHLESLRTEEMKRVVPLIPQKSEVLEIGAGAGWQANVLQKTGFNVQAIDLPENALSAHSQFAVKPYDGHNIPFPDDSFDVIFSSNVLEHIPHIDAMHIEMQRVLKPGGLAIHILPTAAWRFWTSLSHPTWVLRRVLETVFQTGDTASGSNKKPSTAGRARWRYLFWPNRHGEKGNSLTELYWFSQPAWRRQFIKNNWQIVRIEPVGLFYTGNQVLHRHIGLSLRSCLSRFMGSASCMYILKKHDR